MSSPDVGPPDAGQNASKSHAERPSVAYKGAKESPVYRLSELMFGSLLAAYAIGFLGFLGTLSARPVEDVWGLILSYIAVSVAFAYATVGLYLSYHAGILTMHHMPLEKLRYDFLLVVAQAVGFGLSMVYVWAFPLCLGLILLFCLLRQRQEHSTHILSLYQIHLRSVSLREHRGNPSDEAEFTKKFDKAVVKHNSLSGWKRVSKKVVFFTIVLILVGVWLTQYAVFVALHQKAGVKYIEQSWWFLNACYLVCLSVTCFVLGFANGVIGSRARFLYDGGRQMDLEFEQLLKELGLE